MLWQHPALTSAGAASYTIARIYTVLAIVCIVYGTVRWADYADPSSVQYLRTQALRHCHSDTVTQTLSLSFRLLSPRCDSRHASYIHHTEFSPAETPPVILPIGACRSS